MPDQENRSYVVGLLRKSIKSANDISDASAATKAEFYISEIDKGSIIKIYNNKTNTVLKIRKIGN